MARQEFTIGTPQTGSETSLRWSGNVLGESIPTTFLDSSATYYLALFSVDFIDVDNQGEIEFTLSTSISDVTGDEAGQEMSSEWEEYTPAIRIEAGGLSLDIAGPNAQGSPIIPDPSEPYRWQVVAQTSRIRNFVRDYQLLSTEDQDATVLILDDGVVVDKDASATATAGSPSVSIIPDSELLTPQITDAGIISTPQATGNTYGYGEIIQFQITYNEDVEVTGIPRVRMNLGQSPSGEPEYLTYDSDRSDARNLVFTWRVQLTDLDTNGIFFYGGRTNGQENIDLNGGTIRKTGTSINAVVGPTIVGGTQGGHRVNGSLVTERDASALFTAGSPSVIVTADTQEVNADASALFTAGTPTVSSSVGIANIEIRDGPVEASAGIPNVSATAQAIDINRNASAIATAGSPSVSISAASTTTPVRDAIVEVESGNPTVSSTAEKDGVLGQRFNLGDSGSVPNLSDILFWGGLSLPIDSYLVEGNEDSNLGIFAFGRTLLGDAIVVQTFTGSDSTNAAGPNLTSAWEVYDRAVTIIAGDWSITLPGPTHSTALSTDDEEPYSWRYTSIGSYIPFVNQYKALSQEDRDNTVLVLHDGSEPVVIVNADASATATAGSPQVSSTPQAEATFGIANFIQPENTSISFLALLEASGPGTATIYANSSRGGTDTPIEGNLALGPDNTVISRVRNNNGVLLLNDNDQPLPLVLRDYFGPGGEGVGGTFYLQTPDGTVTSLPVTTDSTASLGGGFANFIMPTAFRNHIESISAGERYLFAFVFPDVITDRDASALFEAGSPTVNSIAQAVDINKDTSVLFEAGSPSVIVTAATGLVDIQDASATVTAGTPTVGGTAEGVDINNDASATATAGSPTVISEAAIGSIVIKDTGMIISSGNPTVTSTAEGVDINADASLTITGGNPSVIVTAITMIPVVGDASAQAAAGFPSVTVLPQAIDINKNGEALVQAGLPSVTIIPVSDGSNDITALFEAGLPTVTSIAQAIDINNDASATIEAGLPTVTSIAQATLIPNRDASALFEAGSPTISGTANAEIRMELESDDSRRYIQELNLGPKPSGNNIEYNDISIRIHPRFIAGGAVAYLRYLFVSGTTGGISLRLASTPTGNSSSTGPQFTDAIENYVEAFDFENLDYAGTGRNRQVVEPGPNHSTNRFRDATEPYLWTPPDADLAFLAFNADTDDRIRLTLRDGTLSVVTHDIVRSINAGLPTVTAQAGSETVVHREPSIQFGAGLPTVTVRVTAAGVVHKDASTLFEAGSPSVTINPINDNIIDKDVTISFPAGSPTVGIIPEAVVLGNLNITRSNSSPVFGQEVTLSGEILESGRNLLLDPDRYDFNWKQLAGPKVNIPDDTNDTLVFKTHEKQKITRVVGTPIVGEFNIGDRGRVYVPEDGIDGIYKIQERVDSINGNIGLSLIRDLDSAYITDEEQLGLVPVDYIPVFTPQPVTGLIFTEKISNSNQAIEVTLLWTNPARNDATLLRAFVNDQLIIESTVQGNSFTFPDRILDERLKVELYGVLAGDISEFPIIGTHIVGSGDTIIAPSRIKPPVITYLNNYIQIELSVLANTNELDIRLSPGFSVINHSDFESLTQLGVRSVPLFTGSGESRQVVTVPAWYLNDLGTQILLGGTNRIYIRPKGPGGFGRIVSGLVTIARETGLNQTLIQNNWDGVLENLYLFNNDPFPILVPISKKNARDMTGGNWTSDDPGNLFADRLDTGFARYTTPWQQVILPELYKAHTFNVLNDIRDFASNSISEVHTWNIEYQVGVGGPIQSTEEIAGNITSERIEEAITRWRIRTSIDLSDADHSWYFSNIQINSTHHESLTADELGDNIDINRGPALFSVSVTEAQQTILLAENILQNSSLISLANRATEGDNVDGDFVSFQRGGFAKLYYWTGTQWRVAEDVIGAEFIAAVRLSAITGNFSELNVEGTLSARNIDANVQVSVPVWYREGGANVHNSEDIYTFEVFPPLNDILPDVEGTFPAHQLSGIGENTNRPNSFGTWGIPYSALSIGNSSSREGSAKITLVTGVGSGEHSAIIYIWRNAAGSEIYMRPEDGDENIRIFDILATRNNPTSGDGFSFRDAGTSPPSNPLTLPPVSTQNATVGTFFSVTLPAATGGTGNYTYTVTGRPSWLNFNAATRILSGTPSATGSHSLVYDVNDGSDSTNNGFSLVVVASGGPQTITEYIYRRGTSAFSDPSGGTAIYDHTPTDWNRVNPGPTATEDVYRASRVASYSDTPSQSTFTSATAWDAESTPFQNRTGDGGAPATPNITSSNRTQQIGNIYRVTASWGAVAGASRYEWSIDATIDRSGTTTGTSIDQSGVNNPTSISVRACNDSNECSSYDTESLL